jgi:hypothetical protein
MDLQLFLVMNVIGNSQLGIENVQCVERLMSSNIFFMMKVRTVSLLLSLHYYIVSPSIGRVSYRGTICWHLSSQFHAKFNFWVSGMDYGLLKMSLPLWSLLVGISNLLLRKCHFHPLNYFPRVVQCNHRKLLTPTMCSMSSVMRICAYLDTLTFLDII